MSSFLDYELLKDRDLNLAHLWIQGSWSNKLKIILNQNTHMRLIWRLKCGPVWILPLEQGSDLPIYLSVINHLLSFSIHSSVHPSIIFLSIQPFSVFFFFFFPPVLLVLLTRPQVLSSGGASGKESASPCRRLKNLRFDPWVWKITRRRLWQSTLVFLPVESHG